MAVTVAVTEGFAVKLLQAPEQSSLTAISKEYSIPYPTLMTLQRNNKAVHHTVVLERYCSTTQSSCPPSWDEQPERLQITMVFRDAGVSCSSTLCCRPPRARKLQARRCSATVAPMPTPAEMLFPASATPDQGMGSPDDDFALKLYWGRQRGLAVIYATDAIECASRESKRYFLGETMLERTAAGSAPKQSIPEDAACLLGATPLPKVPSNSKSPQAQLEADSDAHSRLFCGKLVIPEDACSVDGPPTPDNEEADRVCMPAAKRQRLDEASPPAAAVAVARILHLL